MTQSTGHAFVLQRVVSASLPQALPPWLADRATVRRRCLAPAAPHGWEHGVHASHALTAQSTGQAWVLHCLNSNRGGHGLPPCAGRVWMGLVRS
jgi:hypothetical protein